MVYHLPYKQLVTVPSKETIEEVLDNDINELVTGMHQEGLITGAMGFGSVPRHEHSEASDIDLLIRYSDIRAIITIKNARQDIWRNKHVMTDIVLYNDHLANSPFHRDNGSFVEHLTANPHEKRIWGKNPITDTYDHFSSGFMYLMKYAMSCGYIFDGLCKSFIESGDNTNTYGKFVKSCIDKPVHFVRAMVQLYNHGLPDIRGEKMDKNQDLISAFKNIFSEHPNITGALEICLKRGGFYKNLFTRAGNGDVPGREEYEYTLSIIEDNFQDAYSFMYDSAKIANKTIFKLNQSSNT